MNSVISLDGNDIFAVARMFEQININELGDITETIPPELQIFDQNSSAYASTNNTWKSWLKEFDSIDLPKKMRLKLKLRQHHQIQANS